MSRSLISKCREACAETRAVSVPVQLLQAAGVADQGQGVCPDHVGAAIVVDQPSAVKTRLAICLLTQRRNGIPALALWRPLGVSYNTSWLLKHKLMQAMAERECEQVFAGIVIMDDASGAVIAKAAARAASVPERHRLWRRCSAPPRVNRSPRKWMRWPALAKWCWLRGPSATWRRARRSCPMGCSAFRA